MKCQNALTVSFITFLFLSLAQALKMEKDLFGDASYEVDVQHKTSASVNDSMRRNCNGGSFSCFYVNLESRVDMGADELASDIWGWTDPDTNNRYALFGLRDRTAFYDVTDENDPKYLGYLKSHENKLSTNWRRIKTHKNYAYIVADAAGHGLQIFDLTNLKDSSGDGDVDIEFEVVRHYDFSNGGSAHNIFINEKTNTLYLIGSNECTGLLMLDIFTLAFPSELGCYTGDGSISDVQCVIYNGPDLNYKNKEICFMAYGNGMSIVDTTSKSSASRISRIDKFDFFPPTFVGSISHGWLTSEHGYFLITEDIDFGKTRTKIVDITNLRDPFIIGTHDGPSNAKPGSIYTKGNYAYQANFQYGLRVLKLSDVSKGKLVEFGYFDTYLASNNYGFNGALGVYPFFDSSIVLVSDQNEGMFIVKLLEQSDPPSHAPTFLTPTIRPSAAPSRSKSDKPSKNPSAVPNVMPSREPSTAPTNNPTGAPSPIPSDRPTKVRSPKPTRQPSKRPSKSPSVRPSTSPSASPSNDPSSSPSVKPSRKPSGIPSIHPTLTPTDEPSISLMPSRGPTPAPTMAPSISVMPSFLPSESPSMAPSLSVSPTADPSAPPTPRPTFTRPPSAQPSVSCGLICYMLLPYTSAVSRVVVDALEIILILFNTFGNLVAGTANTVAYNVDEIIDFSSGQ